MSESIRVRALRLKLMEVADQVAHSQVRTGLRLWFLQRLTTRLADVFVMGGLHPDAAIDHAAELIESNSLPDALRDAPELLDWFDDTLEVRCAPWA